MSTRKRKAASTQVRNLVRASILVDVETHAKWSAAASLRRMDRSTFAVNAIAEACRSIVLFDRANGPDQGKSRDRQGEAGPISPAVNLPDPHGGL